MGARGYGALARSRVSVENRGLGDARQAVLDRACPRLTDTLDLDEVGDACPHDLRQRAESLDDVRGDHLGEALDLAEQPEAAGLERRVEVHVGRQVEQTRRVAKVEE